jgi:hypothetical protein
MRPGRIAIILLGTLCLYAATLKLYFKDGTYQLVREYKVDGDRLSYYSIERSDWEEIPASLVDVQRTENEIKARGDAAKEEAAVSAAEDQAEREMRNEYKRVPAGEGAYLVNGEVITTMKPGESKVQSHKGRTVLKVLSPLPTAGKATLELDGLHSPTVVASSRPEFYIRLSTEERFGILKMGVRKGNRVVENITIVPVSKETVEETDMVPTFRRQVAEGVYKIWPEKDLEPGEYGVVQYTEGKVNMQVWDFAYRPDGKPAHP